MDRYQCFELNNDKSTADLCCCLCRFDDRFGPDDGMDAAERDHEKTSGTVMIRTGEETK